MSISPPSFARATAVRLPRESGQPAPPEPVALVEILRELRITLPDELQRIARLAVAARQWIEQQYRLALIAGTHRCVVPVRPNGRVDLPIWPVRTVLTVERRGRDGDAEAVTTWWTDLDYRPARVWAPGVDVAVVTCETGYPDPLEVPEDLKQAVIYRAWGYLDRVADDDWRPIVRTAVQPYRWNLL